MTDRLAQPGPQRTPEPTPPQREQPKDLEQHRREALNTLIGEQVIHLLGEPAGLLNVQVWPLWGNHYRVNVLVGTDAVSARVGNSYFVTADGNGNIVESTPKLGGPGGPGTV
jgi:hypothetical protein